MNDTQNDSQNDANEAEELLKSSKEQRRHTSDPQTSETAESEDGLSLEDAIREVYAEIEAGDRSSNLSLRDADLTAAIVGAEEAGELETLIGEASDVLGRDVDDAESRATLLKALIRIGLQELDTDVTDAAVEAKQAHLAAQADSF